MLRTPRFPGRILFSPRDRGPTGSRRSSHRRQSADFRLERLEERSLLSTLTVHNGFDSGTGSLRDTIAVADLGDTITFDKNVQKITLTTGEIAIDKSLDIEGPGACKLTISGSDASRVFDISPDATDVTIAGLTIADGKADKDSPGLHGFGGGILNQGDLTLSHVVVSYNTADGKGSTIAQGSGQPSINGRAGGGGVATFGKLSVTDCTFIANRALGGDNSVGPNLTNPDPDARGVTFPGMGFGAGLYNGNPDSKITDSSFIGNLAQGGSGCTGTYAGLGQGGGIYTNTDLTVTRTSFISNRAVGGSNNGNNNKSDFSSGYGVGGGISSGSPTAVLGVPNSPSADLHVSQSTFSFNQAVGGNNNSVTIASPATGPSDGFGGGIWVFEGSAIISQTTLAYNQAHGGADGGGQYGSLGVGGGIFFFHLDLSKVTGSIENSAIVGNVAIGGLGTKDGQSGGDGLGGGLAAGGLGGADNVPETVTVTNTLVAANLAQGGKGGPNGNGGNGYGGGLYYNDNNVNSHLTLTRATVQRNFAGGGAGSGGSDGEGNGGGVYAIGTFDFDDSVITMNHASKKSTDNIGP